MNLKPEHITWNGKSLRVQELLERDRLQDERENEIVEFLREWYAPEASIQVKTSGSTGTPKQIELPKILVAQSAFRTIAYFDLHPGDNILHCLPVSFIAGKLMVIRALLGNLNMVEISPGSDFNELENNHFQFAAMVPYQVGKLLQTKPGIHSIEHLLIGGSAVSSEMEQQLKESGAKSYSGYGMTETATHIALRKISGEEEENWYTCLENITVDLSPENCLRIYLPDYDQNPIVTTDLAILKNNTQFRITGRADNIINSGGIKLSPEILEHKLSGHLQVPFYFTGQPHENFGEQLVLIVEENTRYSPKEIKAICGKHLGKFEQPKKIIFVRQIPRTSSGKLIRRLP